MKFGVVTFPGSNCDNDLIYTLRENLGQEVVSLWHKDTGLQGVDFVFLPGGFSYGDYLRSGAIARISPVMNAVIAHANRGGFVMGICNGFQILTEAALLPGALIPNRSTDFVCKNVFIRPANFDSILTRRLGDKPYKIPIAHAQGNFYCSERALREVEAAGQVLFRYCDESGIVSDQSNPNGSLNNIAGICNVNKNVFGMMPHPERASDPILANIDGLHLFHSLLAG